MNKSLWINKELYEKLQDLFTEAKKVNDDLTFNKLLNKIIQKGVTTYLKDDTCPVSIIPLKNPQK